MKQVQKLIAAAVCTMLVTGCGSIQSGTTQEVRIASNPAGATVYTAVKVGKDDKTDIINKVVAGVTPLTVRLPRKDGAVLVEMAGYKTVEVALSTRMNPWVWGDIVLLSPLSTSIDTSTGASKEYDPGEYMIDLKPVRQ